MYTKILVPLDGSPLAESSLPHVRWFIDVASVNEVIFLRVVEPFRVAGGLETHIVQEEKGAIEQDAEALAWQYLENIADRFKDTKARVSKVVIVGKPVKTIAEYVSKSDVDLIIMATHGYSGMHRWVRGSIADEIVHAARVPVLLVTPQDRAPDKP